MKEKSISYIIIMMIIFIPWGVNAYKFTKCDFDAPYRCEAIHAVGAVPIMSLITVWFDDDSSD